MKRYEYEIGERVKVLSTITGAPFYATVADRLYSNATREWMYRIKYDGSDTVSAGLYGHDELEKAEDEVKWTYDITLQQNVVVAVLSEQIGDSEPQVIARGHGHIIHDGAMGFAQAAAYALKRIWWDLDPKHSND